MPCKSLIDDFIIDVKNDKFFPIKVILDTYNKYSYNIYVYYWNKDSDKMIGFGMVRGWDEGWNEKVLGLIVHPDERSKGFGSFIMQNLEENVLERGINTIRLHVNPENRAAVRLYLKRGYHIDGSREDGELIMRKEL
jgi:ribosomal-protein-alanine N-acetyltransferase